MCVAAHKAWVWPTRVIEAVRAKVDVERNVLMAVVLKGEALVSSVWCELRSLLESRFWDPCLHSGSCCFLGLNTSSRCPLLGPRGLGKGRPG